MQLLLLLKFLPIHFSFVCQFNHQTIKMGNLSSHETMQLLQSQEVKYLAQQMGNFFRHYGEYRQHRKHKSRNRKRDQEADYRAEQRMRNIIDQSNQQAYPPPPPNMQAGRYHQPREHPQPQPFYPDHDHQRTHPPLRMAQPLHPGCTYRHPFPFSSAFLISPPLLFPPHRRPN